jgi:hypothetical protein
MGETDHADGAARSRVRWTFRFAAAFNDLHTNIQATLWRGIRHNKAISAPLSKKFITVYD